MARRDLHERTTRSLMKTSGGKSYSVTIPIEYIRELKWQKRQKVVVTRKGNKLIIEDWEK